MPISVIRALCAHARMPQTPTTNNNKSHTISQDAVGMFVLLLYTVADIVLHKSYSIALVACD